MSADADDALLPMHQALVDLRRAILRAEVTVPVAFPEPGLAQAVAGVLGQIQHEVRTMEAELRKISPASARVTLLTVPPPSAAMARHDAVRALSVATAEMRAAAQCAESNTPAMPRRRSRVVHNLRTCQVAIAQLHDVLCSLKVT